MRFWSSFIEGVNIDEVWFKTLVDLCKNGRKYKITSGSFAGSHRLEFDFVAGTIHKPIEYSYEGVRKPLAVTVPEGTPAPTTDADIEEYFVEYLMDGQLGANDHYKYATWLVGGEYKIPKVDFFDECMEQEGEEPWGAFPLLVRVPNQVQWCIDHYKKAGFGNNHCCMTIGYPESNLAYDIPYANETERQTSPCMRVVDTKIVFEDEVPYLCFNVYFRSWDCWGGFPVNLGGLALLQEYMANELSVQIGALSFCSKGLHVYEHSIAQLMARTGNSELLT